MREEWNGKHWCLSQREGRKGSVQFKGRGREEDVEHLLPTKGFYTVGRFRGG